MVEEHHTILVRMDKPFTIILILVRMDKPFTMLRTRVTSDVMDGIKVEGRPENLNNITEEGNLFGDLRQGGIIYCTDNIKKEDISKNMEHIGDRFTCDCIDIKVKDTYDHNGDIKQEDISKNLNIIAFGEGFTCDCIDSDIKEEESSASKDNIGDNFNMNKINIKEETTSISHKDNIVDNCLCDNIDSKQEDVDVYMDDTSKDGSPYHHGDTVQLQEHDETKGTENTGII